MARYHILKQDGRAKRAEFHTVHGVIQTPVFMNVGTAAAIKGAVSTEDLNQIKTQVELSNSYHLHVDPYGFRRVSGIFPGKIKKDKRRGRAFPFPCRRKKNFYGTGREHEYPVQSGVDDCHGV